MKKRLFMAAMLCLLMLVTSCSNAGQSGVDAPPAVTGQSAAPDQEAEQGQPQDTPQPEATPRPLKYVAIGDVGVHTIDKALLSKQITLPDASNERLPMWRGAGILDKHSADFTEIAHLDGRFHESDVRFLSENGFDFARIMLSFSSLQRPDYPDDNLLVNENELLELDELLSWGIRYNVHMQIDMHASPGRGKIGYANGEGDTAALFADEAEQALVVQYWKMLAKRYADIPNNYLSFNLINEAMAPDEDAYVAVLRPIIDAVRSESPDRVIVVDIHRENLTGEKLAKLGVALSVHPFSPPLINHDYEGTYEYLMKPIWPHPYFLSNLTPDRPPVTITGDIAGSKLTVCFDQNFEQESAVLVLADGKQIAEFRLTGEIQSGEAYSCDVPAGAQKLTIKAAQASGVMIGTIVLDKGGRQMRMTPHDIPSGFDWQSKFPANLVVNADGSWGNAEGKFYTAEDVYKARILPYKTVAEKYGVGFMIGEWGPYGGEEVPGTAVTDYVADMLSVIEREQIPYSYASLCCFRYIINISPYFNRGNADIEKITYTLSDGKAEDVYVDKQLLSCFTKYMNR